MDNLLETYTRMYVCGPTVYDSSHIGHARTYMTIDIMNRIKNTISKTKTFMVMNITDIDDKIINKAIETNTDWTDVAKKYEQSFLNSMEKLNVKKPSIIIRVSDVLPQIVSYIQVMINKNFAYVTTDGSVYFDTDYYVGEGYKISDIIDDSENEYVSTVSNNIVSQKKNKKDFALWKGRSDNEIGFDVEFEFESTKIKCRGRPGWHIECSAMIHETLGSNIDIHFGGIDLKFPHHHNEQLQAHAYYHPKFKFQQNNWIGKFIHIGHLCVEGSKMSKSLKNFITIDDVLSDMDSNQLRWMFMIHNWKDSMNYDNDTIEQAKIFDTTIKNFFNKIVNYPFKKEHVIYNKKEFDLDEFYDKTNNEIISHLHVFDLHLVTGLLLELIHQTNIYINIEYPNETLVIKIYDWLKDLASKLGFIYQNSNYVDVKDIMDVLIDTRSAIRSITKDKFVSKEIKQKLFDILDKERNINLPKINIKLEDLQESSLWFDVNSK